MANILIHMPLAKACHMSNSQVIDVRSVAVPQVLKDGKRYTSKSHDNRIGCIILLHRGRVVGKNNPVFYRVERNK